jgi:spermidine synthase
MFAHVHPRRILIIGGGDGAILREVLKHRCVEEVVMIEEDESMMNLTKTYFPEYSDCSSLVGVPSNCFDDPRVEIVYQDLSEWFVEEFEKDKETEEEDGDDEEEGGDDEDDDEPFDVIIMDEQ